MDLRTRYLVAVVGCSIISLLSTGELYVWSQTYDRGVGFAQAFAHHGSPWLVFAAVAPWFAAWSMRFRFGWPPRASAILANLAGAAATMTLFAIVASATDQWFGFLEPRDPFWVHFRHTWVSQAPFTVITYCATVGVGYAAEYTRRSGELARLQAELTQAQLSALRMQLNPHFLFNALHTIAAIVREHDERQAVELIERLGDVLRHVLRSSSELEAPLASEVSFLRKYLEIEQVRFGDRLEVAFAIDETVAAALVPQLIIQPLVENALRHGLAPRAAPGKLSVTARQHAGALEIQVSDNGLGLRDGWGDEDGLGLANVRARLSRMYGPAGRLWLVPAASGGVIATIALPFHAVKAEGR